MVRKSITLRLTLLFGAGSAAVLFGLGMVITSSVESHFLEMDADELHGRLELVRHLLSTVQSPDDLGALPQRLDDALIGRSGLAIAVIDPKARTLFAMGAGIPASVWQGPMARLPDQQPAVTMWQLDGHTYRGIVATVSLSVPGDPAARIAIGVDIAPHVQFLEVFRKTLWISIGLAVACTALLGWLAASRGLRPVHEMARVAQGISASRLQGRIDAMTQPVELTELVHAFNGMLGRLQDSFARLSDFSSDLAHELRTPVSNLMTQTQVALSKARSTEAYRETLYSNLEEFNRLARMIADMLLLAKADHGLMIPSHEAVNLAAEVQGLFEFYEALAEESGISLQLSGSADAVGDTLMLRRALSNLISNAIRHTPKGGAVRVAVGQGSENEVEVEIRNPGAAIPPEHLDRIFDRFYRIEPSRQKNTEGAGLGLAITKSIVEAHGGTIEVSSSVDGTSFTVVLPARRPGADQAV
jgi:two-component system heavy metal sensor histidine kinase CusS